jgi:hypothetical protein
MQYKNITKQINENTEIKEIDKSTENVWSFLLLSGYLIFYLCEYISKKISTFLCMKCGDFFHFDSTAST